MKRTRSPSPPSISQRRKLTETAQTEVSKIKSIKALEGVELHPLLSTSSVVSVKSESVPVKENPFLAHWNTKPNKKKERIPHVDRRLATEPTAHRPRQLKFNAPGKFVAKAEAGRTAAQLRQLEREIAAATEELNMNAKTDMSVDVSLVEDVLRSNFDEVDWWNVPFIRPDSTLAHDLLGNLIQRPSLTSSDSNYNNSDSSNLKIYLTADERKKLRRQRRLEAQKELQEKIALGLLPPPPPKVKLSSLPRMLAQPGNALGDESVQDPTRIAAEIRAQSAARHEAHQQSNAERKLTEEERAAKKFKKFAELDAEEVHVAVFKLNDRLEDGGKRFKVLINAEQNHLHGRSVTTPNFTLIIVEGGPKGIKRYTRLLLERLEPSHPNWAQLLWTGSQPFKTEKLFALSAGKPFQMTVVEHNFEAVEYLEKWGYAHFWSLASTIDQ